MTTWLYLLLRAAHFLGMAIWIGGGAIAPIGMRASFDRGADHAALTIDRLHRVTPVIIAGAFLTVLSGGALVYAGGGFSAMPLRINLGAAIAISIFVIGGTVSRPLMNRLTAHFANSGDVAAAEPLRSKFLLAVNVEMALRLIALALMVLK